MLVGCTGETSTKTSLFEHDHALPAHWPSDLPDAAAKLRERLAAYEKNSGASIGHEIQDIVSWTAEIAADTDLAEADWVPLYEATEPLTTRLQKTPGLIPDDVRGEIQSLCDLIDLTAAKVPKSFSSTGDDPS